MKLGPRRIAWSVAVFLGIIIAGAWPSPRVALGFSAGYSRLANLWLDGLTFGERGHAQLQTLSTITRRESDNVTADTVMSLSVDGYGGTLPLGISIRRDVYMPLLIVTALLVAFPLALARRLTCLLLAAVITLAAGVAANTLVAAWTFSVELRGVYAPAPIATQLRELAYGALLLPPGNRFIAPLVLGIALHAWAGSRSGGGARTTEVAPPANRQDDRRAHDDDQQDRTQEDPGAVAGQTSR